ncbi:uncharacterized protein SPSK_01882 [Sporothrix schenckii 1099-18]|uniref:Uncharacterized protein n=1 Tax=Sporothrix schenckii 1099-18 TaxID=1397361 RepID=A0A0F2MG02_SPOSC|nr:uncharacterized protein SPSK_01882 [Sporothrix schenckii 1099-18]KJR87091.1 hypothetical protein SPSK_01882 [Sporothrix schenckii 1099-18]
MPSPDQLQLPNPAGPSGQGQTPGTGNGPGVPSTPSYYAFGSSTPRHYARPPGHRNWQPASYATMRMPPTEQPFTDDMQDLQARGKDPYELTRRNEPYYEDRLASVRAAERRPPGAGPVHHMSPNFVRPPSPGPQLRPEEAPLDNFAKLERRRHATTVLDSPELLMMYAQSLNDVSSIRPPTPLSSPSPSPPLPWVEHWLTNDRLSPSVHPRGAHDFYAHHVRLRHRHDAVAVVGSGRLVVPRPTRPNRHGQAAEGWLWQGRRQQSIRS